MDERLRFVARLLEGEKVAELCREFDISRKTDYKTFNRFKDCGIDGLTDRSRRPYRQANRLPFQIEALIVQLKREHPSWVLPESSTSSVGAAVTLPCRPSVPCMRARSTIVRSRLMCHRGPRLMSCQKWYTATAAKPAIHRQVRIT